MKIEKVTINFSAEKLQAIKILAPDTYSGLEKLLREQLEKIYQKSVPQATRTYIEAVINAETVASGKGGNK